MRQLMLLLVCLGMSLASLPLALVSGQDGADAEAEARRLQDEARRRFASFEAQLETLAQKLEASEPERAQRLREAFKRCQQEDLAKNLGSLVEQLQAGKLDDAAELQRQVAEDLRSILTLLMQQGTDPDQTRAERDALRERLEAIED
ncbi:MAG: hypothetical protein AB7K09_20025, partial [Planctomycetota bacterium]